MSTLEDAYNALCEATRDHGHEAVQYNAHWAHSLAAPDLIVWDGGVMKRRKPGPEDRLFEMALRADDRVAPGDLWLVYEHKDGGEQRYLVGHYDALDLT